MKIIFLVLALFGAALAAEWAIKLESRHDARAFAVEHNLEHIERIGDIDIFRSKTPTDAYANLAEKPGVIWAERQIKKKQYTRGAINDPLYASQWHLARLDAEAAWTQGITGRGVVIAIVDDGLQSAHPDLAPNLNLGLSWDYNGNRRNNPSPNENDGHGTSAAGVAAAAQNNGHCGSGVAPHATLVGVRLISAPVYDYVEAKALSHRNDRVKIYSCSWGPYDSGADLAGPGSVMLQALRDGYLKKGSIFVWAGGNGRRNRDNFFNDTATTEIYTIAIGAVDNRDEQSYYSESGACLFAVTPSSGNRKGIVTTDLMGPYGYSQGECTMSFGGTSSATPLAAGVIALLVQKYPFLDARGVQHIIAKGATKIGHKDWSAPNARGYSHSEKFGFGLLVIPKLLATEPVYNLKPLITADSGYHAVRQMLPTAVRVKVGRRVDFVEQVEVMVEFYSNYRGEVEIFLTNKRGVVSHLAGQRADSHRGLTAWTYTSVRYWGETNEASDEWTLTVKTPPGRGAQLRGYSVKVYGT
jgi:kexin